MQDNNPTDPGVVNVPAQHFPDTHSAPEPLVSQVVAEDAMTLDIAGVGHYTLMWTPTATQDTPQGYTVEDGLLGDGEHPEGLALALGFAMSEGLIARLDDIRSLATCPDNPSVVRMQLHRPGDVKAQRRNIVVNSSCGICGPREILEENALSLHQVPRSLSISPSQIDSVMARMTDGQRVFRHTGGSHAAAIFNDDGRILALAEDLGRHNALDKAIGLVLLQQGHLENCGAVLSSRLSLEMVLKAVRCDLQILLAVSAPTSLAIEVADTFGVTLCGFVRNQRATVYTHCNRVRHPSS